MAKKKTKTKTKPKKKMITKKGKPKSHTRKRTCKCIVCTGYYKKLDAKTEKEIAENIEVAETTKGEENTKAQTVKVAPETSPTSTPEEKAKAIEEKKRLLIETVNSEKLKYKTEITPEIIKEFLENLPMDKFLITFEPSVVGLIKNNWEKIKNEFPAPTSEETGSALVNKALTNYINLL